MKPEVVVIATRLNALPVQRIEYSADSRLPVQIRKRGDALSTLFSDGNPTGFTTASIVTDVVKVQIASKEEAVRVFRVINLGNVGECKARLFLSEIFTRENGWAVHLTFKVVVTYYTTGDKHRFIERLIFVDRLVPFPPGCEGCDKLRPYVEVTDVFCDAEQLLGKNPTASVDGTISFTLTVKGLKREEITVLTPGNQGTNP